MRISFWHKAAFAPFIAGIVLILKPVSLVSYFAYPILVWGLLGMLDAWNLRKWNHSLMRGRPAFFWGMVVPASSLFWLFFEFLNLLYPQWRYLNVPANEVAATLLSFLSYSTVIPLVMEVFWLFHGPEELLGLSGKLARVTQRGRRWILPAFALALLLLFLLDRSFVTAQVMWCIPLFVFLPFVPATFVPVNGNASPERRMVLPSIIGAAFLSGLIWELGNYWARTKWDYLLLRNAPHLFEMPIAGYLGYIPFAFSVLTVYLWLRARVAYSPRRAIAMYGLALAASYLFIVRYFAVFPP